MQRIRVIAAVAILAGFISLPHPTLAASKTPNLAPDAVSAILYDESRQQVIYQKNANEVFPLASLSKIVAVYTFLQIHPTTNTIITYRDADEEYNYLYCARGESAKLSLQDGDTLSVKDLIQSSLMMSTNNTIETLVRVSGMSRDNFIAKMNKNAAAWGATHTKFIEPTGLAPENVSTAKDYAIITRKIYSNSATIKKASSSISYTFKTRNTKTKHTLTNVSTLVRTQEYPATLAKTGYLYEAQHNLMTRISTKKGPLTAVVFGVSTGKRALAETRSLLDYGIATLAKKIK